MSTKQSKLKAASSEAATPLEVFVAPQNGKTNRKVVVRRDGVEFTDEINPFKATAREALAKRVSEKFGIEDEEVLKSLIDEVVDKATEADAHAAQKAQAAPPTEDRSAQALKDTPEEVMESAEHFLENPDLIGELKRDIKKLGVVGEVILALTLYLVAVSRKLARPLGASVTASSSTGKSFVTEKVTSLVPPEDLLLATSITSNALYYMLPGVLKHCLVVVGERMHTSAGDQADAANATLALREMLSAGVLRKVVPTKGEDGSIQTRVIEQQGPIAYVETTTQQNIFEEDATRMLSLGTNESPAQTEEIMRMQARQAAGTTTSPQEQDLIRQKHHTAQRLLKPVTVRIPFAEHLVLPATKVIARRAFPQLLAVIEVVALLRQRQKAGHADGLIDADLKDYRIARRLMMPVIRRTYAPVGERAMQLLADVVEHSLPGACFTRSECVAWGTVGKTEVRNRIEMLVDAGLVEQLEGTKGKTCRYKIVTGNAKSATLIGLPTVKELRKLMKQQKEGQKGKK